MKRYLGLHVYNLQSTIIFLRVSFYAKSLTFLYRFYTKKKTLQINNLISVHYTRLVNLSAISLSIAKQEIVSERQLLPPMCFQNHAVTAYMSTSHSFIHCRHLYS